MSKILARIVYYTSLSMVIFSGVSTVSYANNQVDDNAVTVPVVIVGGGLAGLITAYELNKAGIGFVLLEARNRLGGRVNTAYYPDHATAEAHMEEYWERTFNYTLLKELKVPLVSGCAYSSVMINHLIYPHQDQCDESYLSALFNPAEEKAFKSWSDHTWAIYEKIHQQEANNANLTTETKSLMNMSFADYVKSFHLPLKVSEWIRVSLEPEISVNWDEISALDGVDDVRGFIAPPGKYAEKTYHVKGGNNNYIYALRDQLPKSSIKLQSFVTRVVQHDHDVTIFYTDKSGQSRVVKSSYAVITVPLFSLAKIKFTPGLPKEKLAAISTTSFASYIKVNYRLKPEATKLWDKYKKDGLFPLLTDNIIGTIYNPSSDQDLPKNSDLVMTVLIHGQQAKAWSQLSKQKISELTAARIDLLFPGFSKNIDDTAIYVYPTAIAYWPLKQHRSRFDTLATQLREPFGRIQIGGDTTEDSHSEGAAKAAVRASDYLIHQLQAVETQ